MPSVRVLGFRVSPFVEKVLRALAYKQIDFQQLEPASPLEMRRWSPQTGKMPVLELDGEHVFDSTLILRRLDERFPERPLLAGDSRRAASQRLLEDWSDESLYWMVMAARWAKPNAAATAAQISGALAPQPLRPLAELLLRWRLPRLPRAQGFGRLPYELLLSECAHRLDELVLLLGDAPYFHADPEDPAPSAADFALFGQLATLRSGPTPDFERLISHRPGLVAFEERMRQIAPL